MSNLIISPVIDNFLQSTNTTNALSSINAQQAEVSITSSLTAVGGTRYAVTNPFVSYVITDPVDNPKTYWVRVEAGNVQIGGVSYYSQLNVPVNITRQYGFGGWSTKSSTGVSEEVVDEIYKNIVTGYVQYDTTIYSAATSTNIFQLPTSLLGVYDISGTLIIDCASGTNVYPNKDQESVVGDLTRPSFLGFNLSITDVNNNNTPVLGYNIDVFNAKRADTSNNFFTPISGKPITFKNLVSLRNFGIYTLQHSNTAAPITVRRGSHITFTKVA